MTVTDRGGDAATSALAASVGLTDADLVAMYRTVALARAVDERMWILNRAGRVPFVISGQGHEGAQVGLAWPLRQGHDWVAPYYRSIATCLAFGHDRARPDARPVREGHRPVVRRAPDAGPLRARRAPHRVGLVAGRDPDPPRRRHRARREDPQGRPGGGRDHGRGQLATRATSTRRSTSRRSTSCRSCSSSRTTATRSASRPRRSCRSRTSPIRASGYGMPGVIVDGTDVLACYAAGREAIDRARTGGGPTLIEAKVTRLTAH